MAGFDSCRVNSMQIIKDGDTRAPTLLLCSSVNCQGLVLISCTVTILVCNIGVDV